MTPAERAAFRRGAEKMREMAVEEANRDLDENGSVMIRPYHEIAEAIASLPIPEPGE